MRLLKRCGKIGGLDLGGPRPESVAGSPVAGEVRLESIVRITLNGEAREFVGASLGIRSAAKARAQAGTRGRRAE